MERKPFEIVAECEMSAFPTGADVAHVSEQIERARRAHARVVQAAVSPPAIFRSGRYLLQTRFVVCAADGMSAAGTVEDLLKTAKVACRTVYPSSRALAESDVRLPSEAGKGAPPSARSRPRRAKRAPKVRAKRRITRTSRARARRKGVR